MLILSGKSIILTRRIFWSVSNLIFLFHLIFNSRLQIINTVSCINHICVDNTLPIFKRYFYSLVSGYYALSCNENYIKTEIKRYVQCTSPLLIWWRLYYFSLIILYFIFYMRNKMRLMCMEIYNFLVKQVQVKCSY